LKKAADGLRSAVFIGSGLLNYLGVAEDLTEALFYSSLPLFMKSVYTAVKKYTGFSSERKVLTTSEAGFRRVTPTTQPSVIPIVHTPTGSPTITSY